MSIFRSRNWHKICRGKTTGPLPTGSGLPLPRKKLGNTFPNDFKDLPEIVENIIWHLDGRSVLRAKQVSHSWKEIIEHLERYYQLWRHLCLCDIHRASLIDIIGFNPLSDDYQQNDSGGDDADFEDLWKNVYRSWRTGQTLSPYKQISHELTGVGITNPLNEVVQIGTYVYILKHYEVLRGCALFVWNIDTGHRAIYSQKLKGISYPSRPSAMFPYLQNPLCKFSKHQDLTQHSLIIPADDNSIQWWVFSDGEFRVAKILHVGYEHTMGVWHNLLVIASEDCIKVYILESKENEYNFHLRNMTKELPKNLRLRFSIKVWDKKCLIHLRSDKLSFVIYDLDDLQPQVFVPPKTITNSHAFTTGERIFGDCILFTIYEELYVFNTKTGEQVMLKVEGAKAVARYELHGDLLVMHHYRPMKEYIRRINASGQKDPVWFTCTDETRGSFQAGVNDFHCRALVLPDFEAQLCSSRPSGYHTISYGKGGVLVTGRLMAMDIIYRWFEEQ